MRKERRVYLDAVGRKSGVNAAYFNLPSEDKNQAVTTFEYFGQDVESSIRQLEKLWTEGEVTESPDPL